jgi:hypothetical protein
MAHSKIYNGPVEGEKGTYVAASTGWHFWNLTVYPLLGEEISTSSLRKRANAPQVLGEAARA